MFIKCLLLLFFCCFVSGQYYRSYDRCLQPRIENGYARVKQRGSFVKYTCRANYILMGSKYATCKSGRWDLPPPICIRSGCTDLPPVKNALKQPYYNDAWVLYFCLPGYKLVGSPVLYCNGRSWNGTVPNCIETTFQPKTSCDFEDTSLCGWKQDELHDFDWKRLNKKTPSSILNTGPSYDHTLGKDGNGYYMYIESTSQLTNDTARLVSPVFDQKLAVNGCFAFYYHMYGVAMGGLRVYQKPDSLMLYQLLQSSSTDEYKLFEKWGNQGNAWFLSVTPLANVTEDFQIIIEGIRGKSFTSDIAIDDVAILQGENCTSLMTQATTTPDDQSCVGRCLVGFDAYYTESSGHGHSHTGHTCECSFICVLSDNCCPDYLDVCEFGITSDTDQPEATTLSSTSIALPQTQKLVATNTVPPTTSTSTSTSTTTSTTTTTRKPPTTKKLTLKPKPPVTPAVTKLTTTTTTQKPTTVPTTQEVVTVKNVSKSTLPPVAVFTNPPPVTRRKPFTVSKPIPPKRFVDKKRTGGNGVTITLVVLFLVGICCGVLYGGYKLRTARGRAALARLRGRVSRDAEVRFLKTDDDDE
ncbi:uncharacterized protein LOC142983863 [Anticarsia gemmatalis]|uniref:uncharacterized protein LOC142983863 n=1 Tax=Anticarsia gemmatalis TaxID=129554 RepID=UPI003F772D1D